MKTMKWSKRLAQICAVILTLGFHAPLHAAVISIISSSVTVQGRAGANVYSGSNSGNATGTTGDGSSWSASSSGSITATGASLSAVSGLIGGPGNDWASSGYSEVTLASVFRPTSPNITFNFTGWVGYHAFESYINFSLTRLPESSSVRSSSWRYENDWLTDSLPYTANLALDVDKEYELLIFARSTIGDSRQGVANLSLQIVPEPASAALFAIGLAGMVLRRSRNHA